MIYKNDISHICDHFSVEARSLGVSATDRVEKLENIERQTMYFIFFFMRFIDNNNNKKAAECIHNARIVGRTRGGITGAPQLKFSQGAL